MRQFWQYKEDHYILSDYEIAWYLQIISLLGRLQVHMLYIAIANIVIFLQCGCALS